MFFHRQMDIKNLKKKRYSQTMEYHSALKIIELSSFERIWKNLKCLVLSERRQSEMATLYNSNSITYGKGKTMETVKGSGVSQG